MRYLVEPTGGVPSFTFESEAPLKRGEQFAHEGNYYIVISIKAGREEFDGIVQALSGRGRLFTEPPTDFHKFLYDTLLDNPRYPNLNAQIIHPGEEATAALFVFGPDKDEVQAFVDRLTVATQDYAAWRRLPETDEPV